jgi:MinD-like ATPase involved in chromosome partitioning or flagellar assembly
MTLAVLTAVTGAWEAALVTGLERPSTGVRVVRRCADLAELLSVAAAGLGRAAVVSADLQRLDREAVAQLHAAGVAVVGLVDPADPDGGQRLLRLGVGLVLPADAAAEDVARAVVSSVAALTDTAGGPGGRHAYAADSLTDVALRPGSGRREEPAGPDPTAPQPSGAQPPPPVPQPERGRLIAVWGPVGAPGRTTIAVTMAAELAAAGQACLLVDADTYGASVAQALALLDESAGLAAAARAANQGALDLPRLGALTPSISPGLRVLTGLPRPQRWPELRPSALEVVWDRARELAAWTVVDCGFCLEADEEISFDNAAPRRNGAALSAIAAADVVVAVGAGDPVGLQRLVRGLDELREVSGGAKPTSVVVNRVRAGAVGPSPRQRVSQAMRRFAGVEEVTCVPDDPAACDAAMLAGRTLTETAPGSPARTAIARLAAELCGVPVAAPSRSRWAALTWRGGR